MGRRTVIAARSAPRSRHFQKYAKPVFLVALIAGPLTACEPRPTETTAPPESAPADRLALKPVSFAALPGWGSDAMAEAVPALRRSCRRLAGRPRDRAIGPVAIPGTLGDMTSACIAAQRLPAGDDAAARGFFEMWFRPFRVTGKNGSDGLFTGYFEIELDGARRRSATYSVPVYRPPGDRVTVDLGAFDAKLAGKSVIGRIAGGRLRPYHSRGAIDRGALKGRNLELLWLKDRLDAFMLHVQGSGRVRFADGKAVRIGFAGHNGHAYRSIGRDLIERGELPPDKASWPDIRAWLEANPDKSAELLAVNKRYIFFKETKGGGAVGAQSVTLTPGRSMAVDTRYIPLGLPLWLDTHWPGEGERPLRRLMMAQDTGSAIKGAVRGDFYWGTGDAALGQAGRMKSAGRYYLLLPAITAERMTGS